MGVLETTRVRARRAPDAPVELPFEVLAADGRPVGASVMARLYAAHETPPAATAQERHRLSPVGALGAVTA